MYLYMAFKTVKSNNLKIHFTKKTKMDLPLDKDYYIKKKLIKVDKLPPQLTNKSFLHLLIGPPRSGKSTYVESLITAPTVNGERQSYVELFDEIIFITPQITDFENDDFNELKHVYTEINVDVLESIEALCMKTFEEGGQCLLVLDDMAANLRKSRATQLKLEELCFNHRHMGLSIFFCVQTFVSLSPAMRKSARLMTLFSVDSNQERETIFKDLPIKKEDHQALYDHVFDNRDDDGITDSQGRPLRHTLYIDKSKTRFNKIKIYKDFDELVM